MRTQVGGGGDSGSEHDDLALAVALVCWQADRLGKMPGILGSQRVI